jgi:alginate O-acetyltransferase complex protein AlgI
VFYGWWDWRFLSLILTSTVSVFLIGRQMGRLGQVYPLDHPGRKRLMWLSVGINLGILGFFKYLNFFTDSATSLANALGLTLDPLLLKVLLPVGISFYTFQILSYTIDIYRGSLEPEENPINFAVFVAFFPQLVAGPIERASHLLPQFAGPRKITLVQIDSAVWLIVWGFYKKLVIADNLAIGIVNPAFANLAGETYVEIFSAVLAFAFQIYCDFSAYSDIARGIARLMGFELMVNFRLPYFALNPSDFWNRWHISLSSWLRDYLYIPLGGNRKGRVNTYRNLMLTMVLGGLWHGAAWNFVLWGAYHGVILVIYRLIEPRRVHDTLWKERRYVRIAFRMGLMFMLTLVGWLLFRIEAADIPVLFTAHSLGTLRGAGLLWTFKLIAPLLVVQVWQYFSRNLLVPLKLPAVLRASFYSGLILTAMLLSPHQAVEFIYFQF